MVDRPTLILVAGAPASGKTTLARRLASDLRLPLLEKDAIKESLASVLATPDRDASRRIGAASMTLLFDLALGTLQRGVGVIIESNFYRQFAVDDLARMATAGDVLVVQCVAPPETIERRYRDRAANGSRHAAHFELDALPDLLAGLESGQYDLTSLRYPAITVQTMDGYDPGYDAVCSAVRNHLEPQA